jgi:hypothetical protein
MTPQDGQAERLLDPSRPNSGGGGEPALPISSGGGAQFAWAPKKNAAGWIKKQGSQDLPSHDIDGAELQEIGAAGPGAYGGGQGAKWANGGGAAANGGGGGKKPYVPSGVALGFGAARRPWHKRPVVWMIAVGVLSVLALVAGLVGHGEARGVGGGAFTLCFCTACQQQSPCPNPQTHLCKNAALTYTLQPNPQTTASPQPSSSATATRRPSTKPTRPRPRPRPPSSTSRRPPPPRTSRLRRRARCRRTAPPRTTPRRRTKRKS